ncbi:hypothetical protein EK21DRAFT_94592 [Setomelanomma holmii]|uniref:N-acetyltransferase domain-containing protein n=1 Tax=Setomelanomma holmii TaxID=210430 RepID=A0A9P4GYJ2_9PLEO|nr:hypothetical protein EK21DRAFT_94592 [Setomelanomma holmii]
MNSLPDLKGIRPVQREDLDHIVAEIFMYPLSWGFDSSLYWAPLLNYTLGVVAVEGDSVRGFAHLLLPSKSRLQGKFPRVSGLEGASKGPVMSEQEILESQYLATVMKEHSHALVLLNIAAHPQGRGKGVGTSLLNYAKLLAEQEGRSLLVAPESGLKSFFENRGFRDLEHDTPPSYNGNLARCKRILLKYGSDSPTHPSEELSAIAVLNDVETEWLKWYEDIRVVEQKAEGLLKNNDIEAANAFQVGYITVGGLGDRKAHFHMQPSMIRTRDDNALALCEEVAPDEYTDVIRNIVMLPGTLRSTYWVNRARFREDELERV